MDTSITQILIIEDDPALAQSLQVGLEREGYSVTWKISGGEGVSYARMHNPHLILLDVRLPDGSGFDFCRQMRQTGLRQPIMMVTVERDRNHLPPLHQPADQHHGHGYLHSPAALPAAHVPFPARLGYSNSLLARSRQKPSSKIKQLWPFYLEAYIQSEPHGFTLIAIPKNDKTNPIS